jgi:hypothetical protein
MGIVELFIYLVLVVLIGYFAVWVLGKLAPGHPSIIDNIIWVVVVLVIVVVLLQALGLSGHDPRVPRLGS